MKSFLQTAAGIATAALIGLLLGARIMLDLIGYTTAPDDFALFRQRLPNVLEWLFSTPWWVPSLLMAGLVALAAWLIVAGARRATAEEIEDRTGIERGDVEAIVEESLARLPTPEARTDLATHADIHRHDEGIAQMEGSIRSAQASIEDLGKLLGLRFNQLEGRTGEIAKGCAALEAQVSLSHDHMNRRMDGQFGGIDQAFRALQNREWHQRLLRELDEDYVQFDMPVKDGNGIADEES